MSRALELDLTENEVQDFEQKKLVSQQTASRAVVRTIPSVIAPNSVASKVPRIRLVNALTGKYYAMPDIGRDDNWTVPVKSFEVQDLINKKLWMLEDVGHGKFQPNKSERNVIEQSNHEVRAVLDRAGRIQTCGCFDPDEQGCVKIYFGAEPIQEKCEDIPCFDDNEIVTPRGRSR